jgi:lambda family phage portal protein
MAECTVTDTDIAESDNPYVNQSAFSNELYVPAFEGASTSYRNAHRAAILGDQDSLVSNEYVFLQSRCRYMIRNNPTASAARDKHVTTGGAVNIKWLDSTGSTHQLMTDLWEQFAENPSLDGKGNLATVQAVWRGERFEVGEALSRMTIIKKGNSNKIPLKLHNIASEYLDINYTGEGSTQQPYGRTRYGITFDKDTLTTPEYYNFYKNLYYSHTPAADGNIRVVVPAQDVLHSFERKQANQWRGLPLLAPCLIALYEIDDLYTATVRAQTSASAISWIVSEQNGPAPEAGGTISYLGKRGISDATKQLAFDTSGGAVQYTNGKFNLVQSRDIGSNLMLLIKDGYQKISAALNQPYHQISNDTSGLDFSSLRGILVAQRQRIEFLYNVTEIPDTLAPLAKRFKAIALAMGFDVAGAYPSYQFPRWYGVDDLKDAQADLLEVISGFTPIEAIWAERGYSKEQIEQSIKLIKSLGLEAMLHKTPEASANNTAPTNNTSGS